MSRERLIIAVLLWLLLFGIVYAETTWDSMTIGSLTLDIREVHERTTQLKIMADAAAYSTITQVDGGGLQLDCTSDGTALIQVGDFVRATTALYRRYYHIDLESTNPGASGATWTAPSANTTGGWLLDGAGELLYGGVDVHADWDGVSNPIFEIKFALNAAGAAPGDTVDLKLICYYAGAGDTATKTQTIEEAVTVGAAAQYTVFVHEYPLNYDEAGNVLDAEDVISISLNLETDTSEVGTIIITDITFYYQTTHLSVESGDT